MQPRTAPPDGLDTLVRRDVRQIAVGGGQGMMSELSGDYVEALAFGQQLVGVRVPEGVVVNPLVRRQSRLKRRS